MHILVTGGAGFIGSHLTELLLSEGHSVHVVDDLSTGRRANLAGCEGHPSFCFECADIAAWDGLAAAAGAADLVYHLAAVVGVRRVLDDSIGVFANITGTERLLRALVAGRRRARFFFASSSEVYGFNPRRALAEGDDLVFVAGNGARQSYAVSKLTGEHLAGAWAQRHGLGVTIMRCFNIIGPRQRGEYGMVVPNFVRQAVRGQPLTVFGDGWQTRSFCDVRDAARMMADLAASDAANGEVVNLGNDQEIAINDLAELVCRRAGSSSPVRHLSRAEAYGEDFADLAYRRPDLTRLRALIGVAPRWTLEQTIDDLIAREKAA